MARLVTVTGGLALVAVLLAGCGGGGDDQGRVEASLRHYFSTIHPEDSDFPYGAGPPRVKDKGCVKPELAQLTLPFDHRIRSSDSQYVWVLGRIGEVRVNGHVRFFAPRGRRVSFWHCAVSFGTYRLMRVAVVVQGTAVLTAVPDLVGGRVRQAPARTYTG
jgi:hypothetical protein